eukprot:866600-Pelagomonas_calceolata.AAC.3
MESSAQSRWVGRFEGPLPTCLPRLPSSSCHAPKRMRMSAPAGLAPQRSASLCMEDSLFKEGSLALKSILCNGSSATDNSADGSPANGSSATEKAGNDYLAGSKLTYADITAFCYVCFLFSGFFAGEFENSALVTPIPVYPMPFCTMGHFNWYA